MSERRREILFWTTVAAILIFYIAAMTFIYK